MRNIISDLKHTIYSTWRESPEVLGVCLYGSAARGELDDFSDIDLLVVISNDMPFPEIKKLKERFCRVMGEGSLNRISPAVYYQGDLKSMVERRSLFILHLQLEGKKIFEKECCLSFMSFDPISYSGFDNDIEIYIENCYGVGEALELATNSIQVDFELSVLAGLVRNASISYTASIGRPFFGRYEAFHYLKNYLGLKHKLSSADLRQLCGARFKIDRGLAANEGTQAPLKLQKKCLNFLEMIKFERRWHAGKI